MPTFIKTGFWDKLSRAPKEYLNLDLLLSTVLPSQLGNNGKYLQTDGATASWQTISLNDYVPYTGATQAVDLGAYDLRVNGLTVGKGSHGIATNTAIGVGALSYTSGNNNTAIGSLALTGLINGTSNVAVGNSALRNNITGNNNVGIGSRAASFASLGDHNIAIGADALYVNSAGFCNTSIGGINLREMATGSFNTAIGYAAGRFITTGSFNTIIGAQLTTLGVTLNNNIILADGAGNIKYRWDGTTNTITGDLAITGVLRPTVTTSRKTSNSTLAIADRGKLVEMNVATANNLTIPLDSTVAFPIGTQVEVVQYGAGQTTIVGPVGVTIRSASGNLKIASQYVAISLIKIGTNEWYCFGNLSA